jgi:hypothetical protein
MKNLLILHNAKLFKNIGFNLLNEHDENISSFQVIPAVVNLSLSAELYLKYIISLDGPFKDERKLNKLFNKLKPEYQKSIIKSMDDKYGHNEHYSKPGFHNILKTNSNLFNEWRYIFDFIDSKRFHWDYDFLTAFIVILEELAFKLKNQ